MINRDLTETPSFGTGAQVFTIRDRNGRTTEFPPGTGRIYALLSTVLGTPEGLRDHSAIQVSRGAFPAGARQSSSTPSLRPPTSPLPLRPSCPVYPGREPSEMDPEFLSGMNTPTSGAATPTEERPNFPNPSTLPKVEEG